MSRTTRPATSRRRGRPRTSHVCHFRCPLTVGLVPRVDRRRCRYALNFIWGGKSKEIPYNGKHARSGRGTVLILSKLTSKAQTTIPQPIRSALGLQPGDELLYEIIEGQVILTKARTGPTADDPFRSFEEWHSEADARAYAEL